MPEKEFDVYSVPAKSRFQIFKFGLAGMSGTASILLILLLRCSTNTAVKVEQLKNEQIQIYIQQEAKRQVKEMDKSITPQINDARNDLDSLNHVVNKVLKN